MNNRARTPAELREHYEIEKELADQLRGATRQERRSLYTSLYNELYLRVPAHPQWVNKSSPEKTRKRIRRKMRLLGRFLKPDTIFLEVGPGDCALAQEVAHSVKQVYAVDVSDEITKDLDSCEHFELILSDGSSIPLPPDSVDVAYSNQLMEHLHPEDACDQLANIYHSLKPGGVYLCITPNRLSGPHDISRQFSPVAQGFHLKEYTLTELDQLFRQAGFSRVWAYIGSSKVMYLPCPLRPLLWLEAGLNALPAGLRTRLARSLPVAALLNIRLVGKK